MSYTAYTSTIFGVPTTVRQGAADEVYAACAKCDGTQEYITATNLVADVSHKVNRVFSIQVGTHTVVLQSTARQFTCQWSDKMETENWFATREYNGYQNGAYGWRVKYLTRDMVGTIAEDCTIKHSTLLYIDASNGVALTRERTAAIRFTGTSDHNGRQYVAQAPAIGGAEYVPEIIVLNSDVQSSEVVEHILYTHDGRRLVLTSRTKDRSPVATGVPPLDIYGDPGPYPNLPAISNLWQIIIPKRLPTPLMSDSLLEWNAKVQGFYGYTWYYCNPSAEDRSGAKADGGEDFFYPEWIRTLNTDPFYIVERDMRTGFVCDQKTYEDVEQMARAEINDYVDKDALPSGNYVVDATGNYFYSFALYDNEDLITVNSLNGVAPVLPTAVASMEKAYNLFYPIGLI